MSNYEFDDIGSIPIGAASYRNNRDMKGEEIPEIERLQDEVLIRKEFKKAPFIDLRKSIVFLFSIYTNKSARGKKHGT